MWEKALKANLWVETNLLDDRFTLVVDFFNDKRENIFQRRETIPAM